MLQSVQTDRSIVDLRDSLQHLPQPTVQIVQQQVPVPAPAPVAKQPLEPIKTSHEFKTVRSGLSPEGLPHLNKWNGIINSDIAPSGEAFLAAEVESVHRESAKTLAIEPVHKPAPAPVVKAAAEKKVAPVVPKAAVVLPPKLEKKKEEPSHTEVSFSREHSPDLARHLRDDVLTVSLANSLPIDDIIFELRQAVAARLKVALSRVTLSLRGKVRLAAHCNI